MGAGKISGIYLENGAIFDDLEVVSCADLLVERAEEQAREYGVPKAYTPESFSPTPRSRSC
jgi:predicted dehydrogenase